MLTRVALEELRRSIEDASGREAAEEILFRLGRRWGATDARGVAPGAPLRARLERGMDHMDELGLGRATLEELELDPERRTCRIAGRVLETEESRRPDGRPPPGGESCGVTVGYLTGLASELTNQDLVCTPFRCCGDCVPTPLARGGCPFELRPAQTLSSTAPSAPAPAGSARFFLSSLGASLGGADIALADLLENAGDAILLTDEHDVLRFWNRGAERMFHYRRDEVVGREIDFIVPPDLLASGELERIQSTLEREGALLNYVTRRVTKGGVELSVSLTRTVLRDSHGRTIGSTAIIRDISAQLRTEEKLYHARQLAVLGEMAAVLAHQVKNPLAGIYAAFQVLARDLGTDDEKRSLFDSIGAEIRRLDDSVVDLLRFSRPLPPRPVPMDLRVLLEGLRESLRHDPQIAPHELRIDVPPGCTVDLDEAMMEQLFQNLILNAAQAMQVPGQIRVSAEEAGDQLVVTVEDDGPGVPPDLADAIFDPFVTAKTRGAGLGLSIARKNVEAHGGTIQADRGHAPGACFRITLPRRAAGRREPRAHRERARG